jgi:aspartate kinase
MLIVLKFGGTSLADSQRILTAARRAAALQRSGQRVVVVVSARGHTTDFIMEEMQALCPDIPARESDFCLSTGELLSAGMMAAALHSMGCSAVSLAGWQAGILTDGVFGNARILGLSTDRIQQELDAGRIVVVAGFQGITEDGDITTLGRGGSDTTAVALAAFLKADLCRIYTDVDGVYDRDPRLHPDAVRYRRIGYDDMLTLARQGAQVLHDRSVELAKAHQVPVQVLSSFRPGPGTMVGECPDTFLPDL